MRATASRFFVAAGICLLSFHGADAQSWPSPPPTGVGAFSIANFGPFPSSAGQVLVGMNDPTHTYHAQFVTGPNNKDIYFITCHTAAYNDTPGDLAHAVAPTWYPASLGFLASGSPFPGPNNLPRPSGAMGTYPVNQTGGTTVVNTGGPNEPGYKPLLTDGLIFGDYWVPDAAGGVAPNTKYNIDLVVRAVGTFNNGGNITGLGTVCNVFPLRLAQ